SCRSHAPWLPHRFRECQPRAQSFPLPDARCAPPAISIVLPRNLIWPYLSLNFYATRGPCDKPRDPDWKAMRLRLAVSLLALRLGKLRLLFGRGLFLIALLPFRRRHPVDDFARFVLFQRDALFCGGFPIPIAQTVTAEAGEVHHVDVLHV